MLSKLTQSPLSARGKSRNKTQLSPRKSIYRSPHTVHNQEKLKVFIKFRPVVRPANEGGQCVRFLSDSQVEIKTPFKNKIYNFDHVFAPDIPHSNVFSVGCKDLIEGVFEQTASKTNSNNGLIFVYGNTGTGKTFTMGLLHSLDESSTGIVPDSLRHIFATKKRQNQITEISLSFCQIYMDEIYDLLDFQNDSRLVIRQNNKTKQPYLQNQIIITVNSVAQAFQLINIGLQKRRVAEQRMNRKSSRGHGLITLYLKSGNSLQVGRLCFIDLAGSERIKESESKGATLNEALHINSSLSSLQTLLIHISDQTIRNYRGSKLTRLLQPYIEHGKIHLFVTSNYQSLQSIQFAKRCKGIKFMERQAVKPNLSAAKKIAVNSQKSSSTSVSKDYSLLKKQSASRQKNLLACINNLIGMIAKISQSLKQVLKAQTVHSSFSLSEVMKNIQLQNLINSKIHHLEQEQEYLLEGNLARLQQGQLPENRAENILSLLSTPEQFLKLMHQQTFGIIESIRQFANISEYKNIYKKQYFTSQLKANILQNKNKSFEEALSYLLSQQTAPGNQKKIQKKLKQIGVVLDKQKSTNSRLEKSANNQTAKRLSAQEGILKSRNQMLFSKGVENSPLNHSQAKGPIYIDEM